MPHGKIDDRASGAEASIQVVVDFVVAEVLFEFGEAGVAVDGNQFDARNIREVFQDFCGHRITVAGVVSPSGEDPRMAGGLEIGLALPDGARDGEFGQFGMSDRFDVVDEKPESVA